MITQEQFNGGAKYQNVGSNVQLYLNSERLQYLHNASGSSKDITLPAVANRAQSNQLGLWFCILLDSTSSNNMVLKHSDGTTMTTLTPNSLVYVYLYSISGEKWFVSALVTPNTTRTYGIASNSGFPSEDVDPEYDPFCFEGSDCELADAEPLNGRDGRPTVLAPMFQDIALTAKNQYREAIRAADLVMPNKVILRINPGCLNQDMTHPLSGTTLSDEATDKFNNDGNPHVLNYLGTGHGVSRNPYHLAISGTAPGPYGWTASTVNVKRHIWEKLINYTVASTGASHQLRFRFVMEHTVNPEPVFDRAGGGGQEDTDVGAHGAIFMVYVFCNELLTSFVDGDAWQALNDSDPTTTYTLNDPMVSGLFTSSSREYDKYCHPQMLCAALLPTSMHSPVGSKWVPLHDRKFYHAIDDDPNGPGSKLAHNREADYLLDNGAPWTISFPNTGGWSVDNAFRNVAFGRFVSAMNGRAMTLGGDLPRSKLVEWLCWENQLESGTTYFLPQSPGWDEAVGVLDLTHGNCGVIVVPIDCKNQDSDKPSDSNNWYLDPTACWGHPDEPFEGVGGSHRCFKNFDGPPTGSETGLLTQCCTKLDYQRAELVEKCTREFAQFGPSCIPIDSWCRDTSWYLTQRVMYVDDYNYYAGSTSDGRNAIWTRILPDPDRADYSYAYDSANIGDWVDELGTWAKAGTVTVSTVSGANPVRAAWLYEPSGWGNNNDVIISASIKKVRHKSHGVLAKASNVSGVIYGYGVHTTPVTPGGSPTDVTVQVCKYNGTGKHVLATATISGVTVDDCSILLYVQGTSITAKVTPSGGSDTVLSVEDREFVSGWPGLYTEATSTGNIEFGYLSVADFSINFLSITATVTPNQISVSFPPALSYAYGKCADNSGNGGCGALPECNCTYWYDVKYGQYTTMKPLDTLDIVPKTNNASGSCVNGGNPTWCGGPIPDCCTVTVCGGTRTTGCNVCPTPFAALSFCVIQGCTPTKDEVDPSLESLIPDPEPKMCSGITYWVAGTITCS